jgi:hypothetical protein
MVPQAAAASAPSLPAKCPPRGALRLSGSISVLHLGSRSRLASDSRTARTWFALARERMLPALGYRFAYRTLLTAARMLVTRPLDYRTVRCILSELTFRPQKVNSRRGCYPEVPVAPPAVTRPSRIASRDADALKEPAQVPTPAAGHASPPRSRRLLLHPGPSAQALSRPNRNEAELRFRTPKQAYAPCPSSQANPLALIRGER